jgi:hypothetical protein
MTLPFRVRLAVKIAGIIGGSYYKKLVLIIGELAEIGQNAVNLKPTLEEKCVRYLLESHRTDDINEKMDTLLGMFMIWRYPNDDR